MATTSILPEELSKPEARGGYFNCVRAACGHATQMMVRRQRIILASILCLLPVLLPLALAFLSKSAFADDGLDQFTNIAAKIYITGLAPLLALFFATMLVGEEAEAQTMPYLLTRGAPRSAWVIGRFVAYVFISGCLITLALCLTFAACTTLENLGWGFGELRMLSHYVFAALAGLAGYGALMAVLGAIVKRPIFWGVGLIYFWQAVAMVVPGMIRNLTIRNYVEKLIPTETMINAMLDGSEALSQLDAFNNQVYRTQALWAIFTLFCIIAVFLGLTILTVRVRQYAAIKAAGS